jgi:hypothetical protein
MVGRLNVLRVRARPLGAVAVSRAALMALRLGRSLPVERTSGSGAIEALALRPGSPRMRQRPVEPGRRPG